MNRMMSILLASSKHWPNEWHTSNKELVDNYQKLKKKKINIKTRRIILAVVIFLILKMKETRNNV